MSREDAVANQSTRGWRGVVWGAFAALLVVWGMASGCDKKPEESAGPDTGQEEAEDTAGEVDAEESIEEKRSAYGLPLPPKVKGVADRDTYVEMVTPMKVDALEKFYETRLVDYEVLRPAPGKIRVVGLRQFMPYLRGNRYGPVTRLYYFPKRDEPVAPDVGTAGENDGGIAGPKVGGVGDSQRVDRRVPGSSVEVTTSSGEKLAPGAVWGEPYTPPPGTPLHKPRYRENFGRPLGEWDLP
jgi:hypothetical protein